MNDPDPEIIVEPENFYDIPNASIYFVGTANGNVDTDHAQYTFNVDENQTNIDIGQIRSSSYVEYFFYNGTKSYNSFNLVEDLAGVATLHYDDLIDYEKQSRYEVELWGQVQDDAGVATGWSKISVTINVNDDSTEAPEFYADEYVFKLPKATSDTNNGIYVGTVTTKGNEDSAISYRFTNSNAINDFTLNSVTGEISYIGTGTSEGDIRYLSITATTLNGETTQIEVFITQDGLHDVNETNTSVDETFGFSENLTSGAAIGTITVDGTSSYYIYGNNGFSIDSTTGILSYDGEGFNYEVDDTVVPLTIYAISNDVLTDVMRVEVNIIDVEDPMNLPDSYAFILYENTSNVELGIITATDEDVEDTEDNITYEFLNGTNIYNDFTLDTNTGALTYVGYELDYETNDQIVDEFQVLARSSDGDVKITNVTVSLGNIYEGVVTTQSFDAVWTVQAGVAEVYDVNVSEYFTNLDGGELTYTASLDGEDLSPSEPRYYLNSNAQLYVTKAIVQNNDNQIITITATNQYGSSATQDIKLSVGHVGAPTPSGDLFAYVDEDMSANDILYDIETDDTHLIGPSHFIQYYIHDDPSGLFEIADYLTGAVTLKAGMSLDYDTQSSHVIRIETENQTTSYSDGEKGFSSVRLFWDLTINVNDPDLERIIEPEGINDTSNIAAYFVGTDDGDVDTDHAQYTFNVDENQTNIDIGYIGTLELTEYFFYNGTKSYNDFSLVQVSLGIAALYYDGHTDYETQSQYELELWGQTQDGTGLTTGWSKISVTINVNDDSKEVPEFYADEYVFKLSENVSDENNGIYVGTVATKDNGDSISYSFTDPNAVSNFTLNSTTGEIFYIGTGENFEFKAQHSFSVTATNNDGTDIANVNVDVENVVEPTIFVNNTFTIDEGDDFLFAHIEIDAENLENVSFFAERQNGLELLDWMSIDPSTGVFSGIAPEVPNDRTYSIVVTVVEEGVDDLSSTFDFVILDVV